MSQKHRGEVLALACRHLFPRTCWPSSIPTFSTIPSFFGQPFPDKEEIWESSQYSYLSQNSYKSLKSPWSLWPHLRMVPAPSPWSALWMGERTVSNTAGPKRTPILMNPIGTLSSPFPRVSVTQTYHIPAQPGTQSARTAPNLSMSGSFVQASGSTQIFQGTLETAWVPVGFKDQFSVTHRWSRKERG